MQDSGEGRWTIQAAIDEAVPADVLSAALYTRFRSRQEHTFAEKMLSAMRQKFGGHVEAGAQPRSRAYGDFRLEDIHGRIAAEPTPTQPRIGKPGDPCIMVIFGATGDLTRRKLIPALYNLAKNELLSREFAVIGVARAPMSNEDFRKKVSDDIKEFATDSVDPDIWEWFVRRALLPAAATSTTRNSIRKLKDLLDKVDQDHSTHGNHLLLPGHRARFFRPDRGASWPPPA